MCIFIDFTLVLPLSFRLYPFAFLGSQGFLQLLFTALFLLFFLLAPLLLAAFFFRFGFLLFGQGFLLSFALLFFML